LRWLSPAGYLRRPLGTTLGGMKFDELREQAEKLAHEHKDQIADGMDKASELLKDKVSGHDEQIDKAEGFVKDKLDNL
jgi:hypothetical protein